MLDTFKIEITDNDDYSEKPFDSLTYQKPIKSDCYLYRSVGIGSQISQVIGVYYPTRIDNYCKIVKGCKYYGRYMDDIYIIDADKEHLKELLKEIKLIAKDLGIFINDKKTHIVNLSHGFTFLKIKYSLTESGRIIKRLSRDSITRERRKLKKYKLLLLNGKITYKEIYNAYQSWRDNAIKFNSYKSVQNMDRLFNSLYGEYL